MAFTNSCLRCIGHLTRSGLRWLIASMTGRQITHNAELQSEGDGKESGRRCSLVVVPRSGEAVLFDLNGLSEKDLQKLSLSWVNPHQLSLEAGKLTKSFTVP